MNTEICRSLRAPAWEKRPQMMRMTVTTCNVLKSLHQWEGFRPYNFFLLPVLAEGGYPANSNPKYFRLIAQFESDQQKWLSQKCINIGDPNDNRIYRLTTSFDSLDFGKKAVIETYENLVHSYSKHPESKSIGPDGQPCQSETRGLLGRAHVTAGRHRWIGKEGDPRGDEGDFLESLTFAPTEYEQLGHQSSETDLARPREWLVRKVRKIGKGKLIDFGLGRRILDKIDGRERVKNTTLQTYEQRISNFSRGTQSFRPTEDSTWVGFAHTSIISDRSKDQ